MKKTVRRGPISQESPEIALEGLLRTELHAFALKAGLEVLGAMFESEREAVCGPRYRHIEGRKAYRAAHAPGEPVLGGRRVRLSRPRAREVGGREVVLPSWRAFTAEDPLGERAYEQMVLGVATRGYGRSLEAVPAGLEARGESKSAVSRRLVAATRAQLEEFLSKPLEGVNLKVLMLVGLHFAEHVVLVALGIDADGRKHLLGLASRASSKPPIRELRLLSERGPMRRSPLWGWDSRHLWSAPSRARTSSRTS